jgi:hypothetical protein
VTTDFTTATTNSVLLVLPKPEDVSSRRRALLSHPDSDLALRCHKTVGVCLHTLGEIMHLHGHDLNSHEGRHLAADSGGGAAYGKIKKDAYSINSDEGFVSWDQNPGGSGRGDQSGENTMEEEEVRASEASGEPKPAASEASAEEGGCWRRRLQLFLRASE